MGDSCQAVTYVKRSNMDPFDDTGGFAMLVIAACACTLWGEGGLAGGSVGLLSYLGFPPLRNCHWDIRILLLTAHFQSVICPRCGENRRHGDPWDIQQCTARFPID